MKNKTWVSLFLFLARLFVGLVFAYSGFTKLVEPAGGFAAAVAQYEAIPPAWIPAIAVVVPWLEFLLGCFLILGYAVRPGSLGVVLFSVSFIIILVWNYLATGSFPEDCGCFGEGSFYHLSGGQVIVLDLVNLVLGLGLLFARRHLWSLDRWLLEPKSD